MKTFGACANNLIKFAFTTPMRLQGIICSPNSLAAHKELIRFGAVSALFFPCSWQTAF